MSGTILIRSHSAIYADIGGGADLLMRNIATALDSQGWDVHLLCPRISERTCLQPVTIHEFDYSVPNSSVSKMLNSIRGMNTSREILEKYKIDIVLDDVSHIPFYPIHFQVPDETENAIFMHTAFFNSAWEFTGKVKGTVVNIIDRSLSYLNHPRIICAGESTESRISQITGYTNTDVLHPCVDTTEIEYEFSGDSNSILYLGRLTNRKNVSLLLESWSELDDENYELKIAGTGPEKDRLIQQKEDLGLDNVEFLGYVSEEKKHKLLSESLLFIIPSKMEGYVTSGLEAMAAGTPVIGANTAGINDYINNMNNGILFEKGDPNSLTRRIQWATNHINELEEIAKNGQKTAAEHTYDKFRYKADSVFSKLL